MPNKYSRFISALLLGLVLLIISSFIHHSEICCMFSASRYYGWPNVFITVTKTTDSHTEAKLIKTETLSSLLSKGWEIRFGGDSMGLYGLTSSGTINVILNILFYLALSYVLVFVINRLLIFKSSN